MSGMVFKMERVFFESTVGKPTRNAVVADISERSLRTTKRACWRLLLGAAAELRSNQREVSIFDEDQGGNAPALLD